MVAQVAPVEAGDDGLRVVELQLPNDVRPDVRCGRRGESDHRWPAEPLTHARDTKVARPKVVSPLTDAVCLVDGKQRNAGALQPLRCAADIETLRRDVEELELASLRSRQPIGDLRRGE